MNNNPIFTERFGVSMERMFGDSGLPEKIAVGVSGGADSMALLHALAGYAPNAEIYALTVDHRLRKEGADEARFVGDAVSKLSNVSHHILVWEDGDKQDSRIEERAREARYGLLYGFMAKHGIRHLFLAHHQNDQAETFLFRLSKGSGLDGLACMEETANTGEGFVLCRPFLGEPKSEILDFAAKHKIPYINDPSNKDDKYARVRLRGSMDVLAKEGLTPGRLCVTAKRMNRVRKALEYVVDIEYKNAVKSHESGRIVLECGALADKPLEIVIRVIQKAMEELKGGTSGYGPRLTRVESLCEDLIAADAFRKRTLGGIVFERKTRTGEIIMSLENSREN